MKNHKANQYEVQIYELFPEYLASELSKVPKEVLKNFERAIRSQFGDENSIEKIRGLLIGRTRSDFLSVLKAYGKSDIEMHYMMNILKKYLDYGDEFGPNAIEIAHIYKETPEMSFSILDILSRALQYIIDAYGKKYALNVMDKLACISNVAYKDKPEIPLFITAVIYKHVKNKKDRYFIDELLRISEELL
ncbi:MAG: hypothetical protein J7K83_00350 [Candidatus Aenigmarchaeota archaeon]|nr:hypothetical protein [Candidatus Aenigmarchaeota archaeon]